MYKPNDFNLTNAPEEMVQYVIDNVDDFEERYKYALKLMDKMRCPLSMANDNLYDEILDTMREWALYESNLTDEEFDEFDIEEIFG